MERTFLHGNVRPLITKATQEKVQELEWWVLLQSPYFPNLVPTDFQLFCFLGNFLKRKTFKSEEKIRQAVENFLLSKPSLHFTKKELIRGQENGRKLHIRIVNTYQIDINFVTKWKQNKCAIKKKEIIVIWSTNT